MQCYSIQSIKLPRNNHTSSFGDFHVQLPINKNEASLDISFLSGCLIRSVSMFLIDWAPVHRHLEKRNKAPKLCLWLNPQVPAISPIYTPSNWLPQRHWILGCLIRKKYWPLHSTRPHNSLMINSTGFPIKPFSFFSKIYILFLFSIFSLCIMDYHQNFDLFPHWMCFMFGRDSNFCNWWTLFQGWFVNWMKI